MDKAKLSEFFERYLKSQALPYTNERREIVDYLPLMERHFTIEDFIISLRQSKKNISRATVYRTMVLLLNAGLIYKIQRRNEVPLYELTTEDDHHDHMFCISCGKIIEFSSEELENLQEKICVDHLFKSSFHSLKIYGHCKDCVKNLK
jgi:Fur family ferric uptake transcriptional regulator